MSEAAAVEQPVEPAVDSTPEPVESTPTTDATTTPDTTSEPSGPAAVEMPPEPDAVAATTPPDFSGTAPVGAPPAPVESAPAVIENPDAATPAPAPVSLAKPSLDADAHELLVEIVEKMRFLENLAVELAKSPAVAALRNGEGLAQVIAAVVSTMRG